MTADTIPTDPSVLNTTVLSNFAAIDRISLVADLAGICAVPEIEHELDAGVQTNPYLQPAFDALYEPFPLPPSLRRSPTAKMSSGAASTLAKHKRSPSQIPTTADC